jgi:hypothetical protein
VEREPGRPLVLGDGSSGEESLSVLVQVADLRLLQASSWRASESGSPSARRRQKRKSADSPSYASFGKCIGLSPVSDRAGVLGDLVREAVQVRVGR